MELAFLILAIVLITLGIRNLMDKEIVNEYGKGLLMSGIVVLLAWYFIL